MKIGPRYDGPAVVRMEGDGGLDVAAACVRQRRRLLATLGSLSAEEWQAPSRCDGWTAQDVATHLVTDDPFWYVSITAGLAGNPTRLLATFDPKATPAALVDATHEVSPAETLAQLTASSETLCALVESLDGEQLWSTVGETPVGHLAVGLVVHHALWDCWVHERDVLLPLGRPVPEDPDEVRACLRYVAALGPAFAVNAGRTSDATLVVDASEPDGRVVIEVTDHVAVHDDLPDGRDADVVLDGRAADLVEALSRRAPLPHPVPAEHRWLVDFLGEAFES